MNNRFLSNINYQSLSASSLTSVLVKAELDKEFKLPYEFSLTGFSDFVFFGSAYKVVSLAFAKILTTYPVSITSDELSASAYENAMKYYYSYTTFERKLLDGFPETVTGTYNSNTFEIPNIERTNISELVNIQDQLYIDNILVEASEYDEQNRNLLQNFVPNQFIEDDSDDVMKDTLSVWGTILDELFLYIEQFPNLFNISYDEYDTYRDSDAVQLGNLFGFKLYNSFFFKEVIEFLYNTNISYSDKAIQIEVWKRILNNLIYIYKTKGTYESIKAFLNCIGVGDNLVNFNEYVYYDTPTLIDVKKERKYYELQFDSSSSSLISSSATTFNLTANEWSLIVNLNLQNKHKTQNLLSRPGQYSVSFIDTSVLDDYGEPIYSGYVQFDGVLSGGDTFTLTSSTGDIFNYKNQTLIISKTLTSYDIALNSYNYNGELLSLTGVVTGALFDEALFDLDLFDMPSITSINDNVFYLGDDPSSTTAKFEGSILNLRAFDTIIPETQKSNYSRNRQMLNLVEGEFNENVLVNWEFNEPVYNYDNLETSKIIIDTLSGSSTGSSSGLSHFPDGIHYRQKVEEYFVQRYVSGLYPRYNKINIGDEPEYKNTTYVSMDISLSKILNEKFEYLLGPVDIFDYFTNSDLSIEGNKYSGLKELKDKFYSRIEVLSFNQLLKSLEEYAVGLFKSLYWFLPANSSILYNGILIESPIFDRNKHIVRNLDLTTKQNTQKEITGIDITSSFIEMKEDEIEQISTEGGVYSLIDGLIDDLDTENIIKNSSENIQQQEAIVDVDLLSEITYNDVKSTNIFSTTSIDYNIDYLRNKNNNFSTFKIDNQIICPIETEIEDEYGQIFITGNTNIYLDDALTSGETSLKFYYLDILNDNIIGTKFNILQNVDSKFPVFEVVDLDNSISSQNKNQSFYLVDYNGADIKFKFIPIYSKIEKIKNVLIINENVKQEFTINIIWLPETKVIYNRVEFLDEPSVYRGPIISWNVSLDNSFITMVDSVYKPMAHYGSSLSSSHFTTSATGYNSTGSDLEYYLYLKNDGNIDADISIGLTGAKSVDILIESEYNNSELTIGDNRTIFNDVSDYVIKSKILAKDYIGFKITVGGVGSDVSTFVIVTNQLLDVNQYKIFALTLKN